MDTYIRSSNREIAFSHNNSKDIETISKYLESNGILTKKGRNGVDLQSLCDRYGYKIENVSYNAPNRFKKEGAFRIPLRKIAWGESVFDSVEYFQFFNKSNDEFLYYPSGILNHYKNNIIELKYLEKSGYTQRERLFIKIPYNIGINHIKRYRLIGNEYVEQIENKESVEHKFFGF